LCVEVGLYLTCINIEDINASLEFDVFLQVKFLSCNLLLE